MFKQLAATIAIVAATPALAASFDIGAGSFTDQNFTFGSVATDGSFTKFEPASCADINQGACYRGADGQYQVIFPVGDALLIHPGQNSTSAIRFTAPITSTYKLSGLASSADSGFKIVLYSNDGAAPTQVGTLSGGQQLTLSETFKLSAGQSFSIVVDPSNGYFNDSTTLSGSIAAVPEPATWGLMIVGFGLVGASVRRRRSAVAVA